MKYRMRAFLDPVVIEAPSEKDAIDSLYVYNGWECNPGLDITAVPVNDETEADYEWEERHDPGYLVREREKRRAGGS